MSGVAGQYFPTDYYALFNNHSTNLIVVKRYIDLDKLAEYLSLGRELPRKDRMSISATILTFVRQLGNFK